MPEKRKLDKVSDGSCKCLTQFISLVHASTQQTLNSPRFARPVASFVRTHLEKIAEKRRIPVKAKIVPPLELGDP